MINALIVSDVSDARLGSFFKKCKTKTEQILDTSKIDFNNEFVDEKALFDMVVPLKIEGFRKQPFLFTSFSHGSDTQLLQGGNLPFIATDRNFECLTNAFAICFACSSGKILGAEACENGCLCFIGYNSTVWVQFYFGAEQKFIEAATIGLNAFVEGKTSGQIVDYIKDSYNTSIDEYYETDMLTASLFMDNRDALVIHGDSSLTIEFFIQ